MQILDQVVKGEFDQAWYWFSLGLFVSALWLQQFFPLEFGANVDNKSPNDKSKILDLRDHLMNDPGILAVFARMKVLRVCY